MTFAEAHRLGVECSTAGLLADAEAHFRVALTERPDAPETRYSLANALLKQGRYAEAWPLYEARRQLPRLRLPSGFSDRPEWRGEPLDGRRLIVIGEQGFGDQILFARWLPTGATYHCSPSLFRLFPTGYPGASKVPPPEGDVWCLAGSLPLLTANPGPLPPVQLPLRCASGGGIGVMLTGDSYSQDPSRQFTEAEASRLLQLGRDLSPEATGASDFRDTAFLVSGLDLVITVDTAMAHLAASMGKPAWVLVPNNAFWPWRPFGWVTPWYPAARVYRQGAGWSETLDELEADLSSL